MPQQHEKINTEIFSKIVDDRTKQVNEGIARIQAQGNDVCVGDMFDMQTTMHLFAQMTEMSSQVLSVGHNAALSVARNVK